MVRLGSKPRTRIVCGGPQDGGESGFAGNPRLRADVGDHRPHGLNKRMLPALDAGMLVVVVRNLLQPVDDLLDLLWQNGVTVKRSGAPD